MYSCNLPIFCLASGQPCQSKTGHIIDLSTGTVVVSPLFCASSIHLYPWPMSSVPGPIQELLAAPPRAAFWEMPSDPWQWAGAVCVWEAQLNQSLTRRPGAPKQRCILSHLYLELDGMREHWHRPPSQTATLTERAPPLSTLRRANQSVILSRLGSLSNSTHKIAQGNWAHSSAKPNTIQQGSFFLYYEVNSIQENVYPVLKKTGSLAKLNAYMPLHEHWETFRKCCLVIMCSTLQNCCESINISIFWHWKPHVAPEKKKVISTRDMLFLSTLQRHNKSVTIAKLIYCWCLSGSNDFLQKSISADR